VKKEFKLDAAKVTRADFKVVEYMIRKGYANQKLLDMPGFSGAQSFHFNG
jgi:hypothetical protein